MLRGLIFASVATILIGSTETAVATPLGEVSKYLPSSFAASSFAPSTIAEDDRHPDLGQTLKPGMIQLTEDGEIFSIAKLVSASVKSVGSDSISEVPLEDSKTSIEEMINVASLMPENLVPSSQDSRTGDLGLANSKNPGATVGNLMQNLVNRSDQPKSGKAEAREHNEGGLGLFLLDTILETELDKNFVDTVAGIVRPSIDMAGIVTLNLFGLREIAFLMSPATNEVQVMDFSTMTFVTILHRANPQPASQQNQKGTTGKRRVTSPNLKRTLSAVQILMAARIFVTDYLLHPLTLGTVFVLSMILSFRRMGQGA